MLTYALKQVIVTILFDRQYKDELMEKRTLTVFGRNIKLDLDHRMVTTGLVKN